MVVRKDRPHGAVLHVLVAGLPIQNRIRPPTLSGRLSSTPGMANQVVIIVFIIRDVAAEAARITGQGPVFRRALFPFFEKQSMGSWPELDDRTRGIVSGNPLTHFVCGQGAVFIVPPVARSVRRGHVEFHEVDVLTDRIGRRIHLEIVQIEIARNQIRGMKYNALARLRAKEKRLGRAIAVQRIPNILLQHRKTALRVMPAGLVHRHIHLHVHRAVFTRLHIMDTSFFVDELLGAGI